MKKIFYILTFLLLVIPTSNAFACENSTKKADTEQNSCEHNNQNTQKKSCCDSDSKDGNDCDGGCNNTDCNCPVSVNIPIPVNNLVINLTPDLRLVKIDWTYVQNAPKPVYLSIWQPPKIS